MEKYFFKMARRLSPISCQLTRLATCARNDGRHRRVASTRDDANGVNGQLNFMFVSCHAIIHSFFFVLRNLLFDDDRDRT